MTSLRKSDLTIDAARSALMARVRQKHSAPELAVRKALRSLGIRYSLHRKTLPGSPDICISSRRSIIFVHGCFWHRHKSCKYATTPKTRVEFWRKKFEGNVRRDARNAAALRRLGWKVFTIWECKCRDHGKLERMLLSKLK
jgi:DNA mismatch endonuclease (patch repair protein)